MTTLVSQTDRYANFYDSWAWLRWAFRFDVRYRCRRLPELLRDLGVLRNIRSVLDVGFGAGRLLDTFPCATRLTGAEVSASAVEAARRDPRFADRDARFTLVPEDDPEALPRGPFDVVLSSHSLEHMPDDRAALRAMRTRLTPGGHLLLFVPLEEPGYNPDHVRAYTLRSICRRVAATGFDLVHAEGSMNINGHIWKLITIPSRRRWPVLKPIVDALRLGTLSLLPYAAVRALDRLLARVGVGPRQALVIARRPVS